MNVHAWTFDVGAPAADPDAYAQHCITRTQQSWASGADLVLFPEYTWAGLEPLLPQPSLAAISRIFWDHIWPSLRSKLSQPGRSVVLGTVPWQDPATGHILNRCPIIADGTVRFQDKLTLTPWESDFTSGDSIQVFEFLGRRCAVLICLDVEIAELSVALSAAGIDLLLVPSATEDILGVERVNRCASARAIELGCAVVVAHLTGTSTSTLVDTNTGLLAHYLPSQSFTANALRHSTSALHTHGFHLAQIVLPELPSRPLIMNLLETNPALLSQRRVPPVIQ
jgi:predicted amidohydrolase